MPYKVLDSKRNQKLKKSLGALLQEPLLNDSTAIKYLDIFSDVYIACDAKGQNQIVYRHSYSDLNKYLLVLNEKEPKDLTTLTANLDYILSYLESRENDKKYQDLKSCLYKLVDHIKLETIRIIDIYNQFRKEAQDASKSYVEAYKLSEQAKIDLLEANKLSQQAKTDADEAIENSKNLKTEVVSILGIFSAVVLAFIGGMTFSSSVLETMAKASIYRVSLLAVVCGFVLINTMFTLMYVIAKITGHDIRSKCKTEDCTCEKKHVFFNRIRKRFPYIFYVNSILLLMMALITLGRLFDVMKLFPLQ